MPSCLPRRILIVDDALDTAETLATLLRDMGHHVDFAINRAAALAVAQRERPEVVFLDLALTATDGVWLAQELRQLPGMGAARFVAVAERPGEEDRGRSLDAGYEQLSRPLDPSLLERLLG